MDFIRIPSDTAVGKIESRWHVFDDGNVYLVEDQELSSTQLEVNHCCIYMPMPVQFMDN